LRFCFFVSLLPYIFGQCPSSMSSIANNEFQVMTTGADYVKFQPCGTFSDGCNIPPGINGCTGPGCCSVCQMWNVGVANPGSACLGKFVSASYNGGKLEMMYTGGDPVVGPSPDPGAREALVRLSCGSGAMTGTSFIDANGRKAPDGAYLYEIDGSSSYACGGMSGGWWFIIILIILAVVYVIGGIIYNKAVKKEEGSGFPNLDFWVETPALAKEGVMFLLSKITGGKVGYSSV